MMSRKQRKAFFLNTASYLIQNACQPEMTKMFYDSVVKLTDRRVAGIIQLREVMDATKEAMARPSVA